MWMCSVCVHIMLSIIRIKQLAQFYSVWWHKSVIHVWCIPGNSEWILLFLNEHTHTRAHTALSLSPLSMTHTTASPQVWSTDQGIRSQCVLIELLLIYWTGGSSHTLTLTFNMTHQSTITPSTYKLSHTLPPPAHTSMCVELIFFCGVISQFGTSVPFKNDSYTHMKLWGQWGDRLRRQLW